MIRAFEKLNGLIPSGFCRGKFLGRILVALALLQPAILAVAAPASVIVGEVRVQLLSDSLVRMETKGAEGFEDRKTFHVAGRNWPGTDFTAVTNSGWVEIRTADYSVRVLEKAVSLAGVHIDSPAGAELYHYDGKLENSRWLPAPGDQPQAWWFADTPRIVPSLWGVTAPPEPMPDGGWDLSNNAPDVYVFLPRGNYFQLRQDFLKLTGPTEMMPLFALGAFDSRWHDYSEATALKQIDDYRARKIPLDVLVLDTGWRAGASTGYQPNIALFPDLPRFFSEAHARSVKVLCNDHPEPVDGNASALNARELNFRFHGLAGLLQDGLDVWWYDRNWPISLVSPAPNLRKEAWGMRPYHDATARVRPDLRPLILANVDGIDNGSRNHPMDVSAHRYPFQWTGDIGPGWDYLRRAVENAVYSGAQSLFPYESDDLGGHTSDPTLEQYVRWIEYGALSPVYRPHCTRNLERMPWAFGPVAETVARNYLNLRYRLLPVFYAAAHENYETGEPILRRLDLEFPQFAEARRDDEYLIGRNILVAPVLQSSLEIVPDHWLKTAAGQAGLEGEYFANENLAGQPAFKRTDAGIDFNWDAKSPAPNFPRTFSSVRWTGTIEVPAAVGDIFLATLEDDGARVWIDRRQVIDAWGPHDSTTSKATATITAGVPHHIRVEYQQFDGHSRIQLLWVSATTSTAVRDLWIPPGDWVDAWSGKMASGPELITNSMPLDEIPMYIRSGAILPLAPEMQFTGEKPWNPVTLDLYPDAGNSHPITLYEDDTRTIAYQRGEFRTTELTAAANDADKLVQVKIGAASGSFTGALTERRWILRIHRPAHWPKDLAVAEIQLNGKSLDVGVQKLERLPMAMPFGDKSGTPDGNVFEFSLPSAPVTAAQSVVVSWASKLTAFHDPLPK